MSAGHPFVHLHVHSEYSLLDGAIRLEDLARATAEMGMGAVALTDHGVMFGCVEFYEKCRAHGVKPIIGCEVYLDPKGHTRREDKEQNHLVLLAETDEGYHNLVRLVSVANTDGFYYKPRIDHELLARHSKGLICCSACLGGEIPSLICAGREEEALARAHLYEDIVGKGNFFLELQHNRIPEQALVNKTLVDFARKENFPLVATNDAHYMKQEDATWHEILLCVQTRSMLSDPNHYSFKGDDFYLRSPEEMWNLFGADLPEALHNTVAIAERCHVDLVGNKTYHLPEFELPEGETLDSYLEKSAFEGLLARLGGSMGEDYRARLAYELGVIKKMGFSGYFCIVADIIGAARKRGIPVGPGRGSAAGSVVAWALGITDLDPIQYNLLFERFLNPERISMPDIDTDISDLQRDEVLRYISEKFGADRVAQIVTFGRMKSKAAVKDVGRALGMSFAQTNRVAKLIPDEIKSGIKSIPEAIDKSDELKALYKTDVEVKRLLDTASRIEGLARHCSQHAAGVVITPRPLMDMVPLKRFGDDQLVTQYSMEPIEHLGLVKMDFLGLKTLSVLERAQRNIVNNGKAKVDLEQIPPDDPKVFEMLQKGETLGVFQLESTGMTDLVRRLRPDRFEDLIALLALYRPGPLESGMADQYVNRKHGVEPVSFLHPLMSESLKDTYGVVLYQEQVMQCAAQIAGYTLGEADLLRRAMGKKKKEEMAQQRKKFIEGAAKKEIPSTKAEEIFDIIEKFAGYGFNKSHSAAYALISYHTAYLKAHYGAEFLAAYLSSLIGSRMEQLGKYIRNVRSAGYAVMPPDINESGADFTVVGDVIRLGLGAVSQAGEAAVDNIVKVREERGAFKSLWDFLSRVDLRCVNKGVVENLIKSGAFDGVDDNRRRLLESVPYYLECATRRVSTGGNQKSLFGEDDECVDEPPLADVADFDLHEKLDLEKESTGLYISGHPFDEYEQKARQFTYCTFEELPFWRNQEMVPVTAGLLVGIREHFTKKGEPMGTLEFEDSDSKIEVLCFPKDWGAIKPTLQVGCLYQLTGRLDNENKSKFLLETICPLEEVCDGQHKSVVHFEISLQGLPESFATEFAELLKKNKGTSVACASLLTEDKKILVKLRQHISALSSMDEELERISGGNARRIA